MLVARSVVFKTSGQNTKEIHTVGSEAQTRSTAPPAGVLTSCAISRTPHDPF